MVARVVEPIVQDVMAAVVTEPTREVEVDVVVMIESSV